MKIKNFLFLIFIFCLNGQKIYSEELTMEKAIEIAIQNNSDWKINLKNKENALLQKKKSEAALFPAVTLSNGYSKIDSDNSTGLYSSSLDSYSNSINFNQNIYNRKVKLLIDQAKLSIDQFKYNDIKVKKEIILSVKKAYYDILKLQAKFDVHKEMLMRDEEQLKYAKNLLDMGKTIKSEVLRAEITLEKTKQNLVTTQNEVKSAKMVLCNLLDVSLENDFNYNSGENLEDGIKKILEEKFLLEEHFEKALQNSYELKIKDFEREIYDTNLKIAKTGYLPVITGSGSYNWSDDKPDYKNKQWRLGISLSWTIFDAGLVKNTVLQAENEKDKINDEYKKLEKEIIFGIRKISDGLEELKSLLKITRKSMNLAEENYHFVKEQYKNGLVSNLSLIDAEVVYTEAKINLLDAFYDYKIKLAEWEDVISE